MHSIEFLKGFKNIKRAYSYLNMTRSNILVEFSNAKNIEFHL